MEEVGGRDSDGMRLGSSLLMLSTREASYGVCATGVFGQCEVGQWMACLASCHNSWLGCLLLA